jgi:hypothetical protein
VLDVLVLDVLVLDVLVLDVLMVEARLYQDSMRRMTRTKRRSVSGSARRRRS